MKIESRFLLVIAHPDDEAMFFSPFLLDCKRNSKDVSILCLSNGNFEGLGVQREKELLQSASFYGVNPNRVRILDHSELQDGMNNYWSPHVISDAICEYLAWLSHCEGVSVTDVVGFDEHGVSGHPNHIASFRGMLLALDKLRGYDYMTPSYKDIRFFKLQSASFPAKFSGIISAALVYIQHNILPLPETFRHSILFFNVNSMSVMAGMKRHASQLVWYRFLFVVFSSFSYVNILVNMKPET